uniref:PPM-type phosphatase domain-containing protein n=1 Tax=Noctiluca scintillans TaxID=2966 RepID=A0A7S1A259_NOCSC|mmetsp:Transcript_28847/g.76088  ORF Transcript_28847/g.76088 Transcript_28847/m.76088 type:complete len:401 (+) Transcript_28847:17-1219(+)
MGNAGTTPDVGSSALAAGVPEELDWGTLIHHIFRPEHHAVLLATDDEEVISVSAQPRKVITCLRGTADGPLQGNFHDNMLDGRVGLMCQKGKKDAPNQDSCFVLEFTDGDGARVCLTAVMDGHGPLGHRMSRLAIQWLPLLVLRNPLMAIEAGLTVPIDPQAVFDAVTSALDKVGAILERASDENLQTRLSGTTCVFALSARGLLHCANVGDSRAVMATVAKPVSTSASLPEEVPPEATHDGEGEPNVLKGEVPTMDVRTLTRDHKPEDVTERARVEAAGGLVDRQRVWMTTWPFLGLNMSRSLGDSLAHTVGVSSVPDVTGTFLDATASQLLILGSDGVWDFVSSDVAAEIVAGDLQGESTAALPTAQHAATKLVAASQEAWLKVSRDLDDITVVVIRM